MVGFLIAVLSGVLMSVQGIFNTQVTKASSIWSANVFVQATALLSCLAVWLAADRSNLFAVFRSEPKYLLLGGVLGAGITWTVIKAMAMLGPARAVLFIVVAQIAAAYLVELFGLFGVEKAAWEWRKAIGLAVAAAGIAVFDCLIRRYFYSSLIGTVRNSMRKFCTTRTCRCGIMWC